MLQVFARLDADLETVSAMEESRSVRLASPRLPRCVYRETAAKILRNFAETHDPADERGVIISSAIKGFEYSSENLIPCGWSSTQLPVTGMVPIDLSNSKTMRDAAALCKMKKIYPPSSFVKTHSHHYGKYCGTKLISLLSMSVMKMNRMPGSVAISIDIAASRDKEHSMSIAIDSIKKILRKRRNPCALFAQVAQTPPARNFWSGKLTKTKRASVLTVLVSAFDERYKIYTDTEDMALFFD